MKLLKNAIVIFNILYGWTVVDLYSQLEISPFQYNHKLEQTYGVEEGLPDICIKSVLIDSKGKIHLSSCGNNYISAAIQLYEFDGTKSYISKFKLTSEANSVFFYPPTEPDNLFGYFSCNLQKEKAQYGIFEYNPITKQTNTFITELNTLVHDMFTLDDSIYYSAVKPINNVCEIVCFKKNDVSVLYSLDIKGIKLPRKYVSRIAVTKTDLWLALNSEHIYRINRNTGKTRQYKLDEKRSLNLAINQLKVVGTGDVWINANEIYRLNATTGQVVKNPFLKKGWLSKDIDAVHLTKDLEDNVLIWYKHKDHVEYTLLMDNNQQVFDYSKEIIAQHEYPRPRWNDWYSTNFKKKIIFYYPKLRIVEFVSNKAIQKVNTKYVNRAMVQLNDSSIYSTTSGLIVEHNGSWKPQNQKQVKNSDYMIGDIKIDSLGNVWSLQRSGLHKSCLFKHNPNLTVADSFNFDRVIERFEFFDNGNIVFANIKNAFILNTTSRKIKKITKNNINSRINQIHLDKNKVIWIASLRGFLKLDINKNVEEWIHSFGEKTSVTTILPDKMNRLWLGTVMQGILIYDPVSKSVKSINESNGLSNNVVVNLIEDNDGIIWAGTFNGITLISKDGVVKGKLYAEDGLMENECNRWSVLKLADGRLCFGSDSGISIIDPELLKKRIQEGEPPLIYLTGLSNEETLEFNSSQNLLEEYNQNRSIEIPANNRNLKSSFAMSNYAAPQRNVFSYKIEGFDKDWKFIGKQRELYLNGLPAGKYRLLINGSDGWGRWAASPIVISLNVHQFFYKKWWFYLFCSTPFIGFLFLWINRQVGERSRLEQEVASRTLTIQNQADKLKELDKMKSSFYTNITHEFRTPLTVISGMADMIEEKPNIAREFIKRNTQSLLQLINQVLDLAKLESGNIQVIWIQTDIVAHIKYVTESLQSYAHKKKMDFYFYSEVDELIMDIDEKKLETIIVNLLSNAIKFSEEEAKIILHLKKESENSFLIKLKDNGIGISAEKLPYIFDRFYQVMDSPDFQNTQSNTGSGIGLTLTKDLVEVLGGKITVESTLGEGTEFTISLPIHNHAKDVVVNNYHSLVVPMVNNDMSIDPDESLETNGSLPIVLLIEDNRDVAFYIQVCLKDKYYVEWAQDGHKGIERAFETIPDAIISDVMMPVKDGLEVCDTLKNDIRTSHIPIILLTAKADIHSKIDGLAVGADAYLTKPFLKEELFIHLEKMLELRIKLQKKYTAVATETNDFIENLTSPTLEDVFLDRIRNFVLEHLSLNDYGSTGLAKSMLLSESQLYRKIKVLTGKSTAIYMRSIRLHKAKELIQSSDLSISEIAYNTGFSDPTYFSRTFAQEFGIPPSSLRK